MNTRMLLVCMLALGILGLVGVAESGDVEITWYGHSIFTIAFEDGLTVLTDPFEPGLWGMTYPIGPIDGVSVATISHEHEDHNYAQLATGDPVVLRGVSVAEGVANIDETVGEIRFYTVETCHGPDLPCPLPDANAVFVMEGYGLRIAHLGDLGHVLTEDQAAAIGDVDILLIPVGGGGPTIEADRADEVIAQLQPVVIIAMHYETPALGWGIDPIDPFLVGKNAVYVETRSVVVNAEVLPEQPTVFVLPYQ